MIPKIHTRGMPVETRRVVKEAINLFMDNVMQDRTVEKIEYIKVEMGSRGLDSDDWALTEIDEMHDGKPVGFIIRIRECRLAVIHELVALVMHEMTHVWQFVTGKLNIVVDKNGKDIVRYKRRRYNLENIHYSLQPWEIEAHGYELCLSSLFWEVRNRKTTARRKKSPKKNKIL